MKNKIVIALVLTLAISALSVNADNVVVQGGNMTMGDKITFAFGEVIHNLLDGWITLEASLNVTGSDTALPDGSIDQIELAAVEQGISTEDLALAYHFPHKGSNTTTADFSGNGNDGSIVNALWTPGKFGTALEFDGSTSYVNAGSDSSIDDIFDNGGTVSAWINVNSDGENNQGRIFDKSNWRIKTISESAGQVIIRLDVIAAGLDGIWETTNREVNLGTWHNLVVVYNSSSTSNNAIFYIDGFPVDTKLVSAPDNPQNSDAAIDLYVGDRVAGLVAFDGSIDEVLFWNRTLSADEILTNYLLDTELIDSFGDTVIDGDLTVKGNLQNNTGDIAEYWHSQASATGSNCNFVEHETEDGIYFEKVCPLEFESGDVVCADPDNSQRIKFCSGAYDVGVLSVVNYEATLKIGDQGVSGVYPLVIGGNVPVKVECDTPIAKGDLLVSAATEGYAQSVKVWSPSGANDLEIIWNRMGAPFAKALEPCLEGTGIIRAWLR